jgi:hypothetical protein
LVRFLAVLLALTPGCAAHVLIEPPPPATAPVELRQSYYEQHAPAPVERGELEPRTRFGESHAKFVRKAMHLQNGARVAFVEDLKPLVDDQSSTAKDIEASLALRDRANLVTMAGVVVGVVGVGAAAGLMVAELTKNGLISETNYGVDGLTLGAAGALLVGGAGGGAVVAWGQSIRDDEEDARLRAFKSLDESMRARLALPESTATGASTTQPTEPSTPTPTPAAPPPPPTPVPLEAPPAPATPAPEQPVPEATPPG